MGNMFNECKNIETIIMSNYGVDKVQYLDNTFKGCVKLTTIDLSNFDTRDNTTSDQEVNKVAIFTNYNSLKTYVSGNTDITTIKIEDYMSTNRETNIDAGNMFKNCTSLVEVDPSEFDTSNIVNMSNMFDSCSSLVTIYVSDKWNIDNVVSSTDMFNSCTLLVGAVAYDENNANDKTYANQESGYLTYKVG